MSRTRLRLGAAALAATLTSTLVVTLATPATSASTPPEDSTLLVIGTYNIHENRSVAEFTSGLEAVKERVQVLGMQEIPESEKHAVIDRDRLWAHYHPPQVRQDPVLWRRDVFDFLGTPGDSGYYRLARARWVENKRGGMERKRSTYATIVRLAHRATGEKLSLVNVHLLSGSVKRGRAHPDRPRRFDLYSDQMRKLRTIVRREEDKGYRVFTVGDFNADYQTDRRVRHRRLPFRQHRRIGYASMWHKQDLGRRRGTFNRSHLDGVWARSHAVSAVAAQDIDFSDHQPAIATYRLPDPAPGYQPPQGSFGFADARVENWECSKPWHTDHAGPLRFELTGDNRYGFVDVRVINGTAKEGEDFVVDASSLFDADLNRNWVDVTPLTDFTVEGDETFTLELIEREGATVIASRQSTGVLLNDDELNDNGVVKWTSDAAQRACTDR